MDNAVCSLIRMDMVYPDRFTNVIVDLVLQHLPLRVDTYEESSCVTYFEELLNSNPSLYLSHLKRIVRVYADYAAGDEIDSTVTVRFRRRIDM